MRKKNLPYQSVFFTFLTLNIVLLCTSLMISASAQANTTKKDPTYTIGFKNEPILKVFNWIERASGYRFSYNKTDIKAVRPILIEEKQRSMVQLLTELSSKSGLDFRISSGLIAVSPKENPVSSPVSPPQTIKKLKTDTVIQGQVLDTLKKPLVSVSVYVKGKSNIGTSTDQNGRYSIKVPQNATLVFKMVGFIAVEEPASRPTINVILREEQGGLDEVVVTAFGKKQRKEAVVGSVTSITAKELKIPSSNLTTALAGRIAGVVAYQRSGEPGADNANFFVRGVTTFGNGSGSPLILIDNIELTTTDLARLQPDDIESFSVLKDASATALYGARGANGVIFITTKQGKQGTAQFTVRLENSISTATQNIEIADPVTHMQLYTEAQLTRDPLAKLLYQQNKIDHTIAGDNPVIYPATNWTDLLFNKRTSNQRGNLSVRGGGKVAQFYVAGSYNKDNGTLKVDERNNFNTNVKLSTYQLRSNVNMQLGPQTELVVRFSGYFDDYNGPIDGGSAIYTKALRTSPTLFAPYYAPDAANIASQHILFGNYRSGTNFYLNPYADLLRGYKDYSQSRMLAQLELNQKLSAITEGLNFRSLISTNRYSFFDVRRAYGPYFYGISTYDKFSDQYTLQWQNETEGPAAYEDIRSVSGGKRDANTNLYAQAALDYNRFFGSKHNVGGALIFTMQQSLSPGNDWDDVQVSLPRRNIGLSGRASYAYDNRYFAEFNFGYNGSERFYSDQQFGFFPTFGLGWVVSNESFWKAKFINKLKIRGSYGLVGNDRIGRDEDRFFYLSRVNLANGGRGANFGYDNATYKPGVSISRYPNLDITWEKSYQSNIAIELSLFNKLNFIGEFYQKHTKNILQERSSIPTTMGLSTGILANVGEAKSKGVDLSLDYTENLSNDVWFSVRGSFTFARGEYSKFEEPAYNEKYLLHPGQSISQAYGYIAERLFIDEKDVQNSPKQTFGIYQAGDIKYRDINGDGQITTLDRVPIGNPTTPEITYGGGISAGYKNFDFSVFLQGLARESFFINTAATAPFVNYDNPWDQINGGRTGENALIKAYADSHWSEENRNIYALWPRLSVVPVENNNQTSTWFMRNGSFLRVKSVEVGYTLPKGLSKRIKAEVFRVYFSGLNLFQFSKFKLWDPEMGTSGMGYPLQKVFNFGLNVNF
ncbi:SusC/RagA family TonB-linked outer membrane protein [Pedobacter caeni]|uniref:TonB-linked outer membrane protein, SusC/RagA family n=1 Tax=Pedobacter caeni TaxID=288992 RepID=A0A1M5BNW1_9SPHI|nr:TonB-dependent receptor [Pedobacter caeni]SHF44066.1 TonB-linked outer membrane protein, SusC/RagA family [Pedobacter caeni]